jgi:N-acetylmuramoyl-L-alanine amidase
MIRLLRAASLAAASFVAVFGTFYAGPSRAGEYNGVPALSFPAPDPVPADTGAQLPPAPAPASQPAPAPEAPAPARTLAQLVSDHSSTATADAEHECLAGAVFFESKGEPLNGQLSVAEVVLNRARSGRFPSSICGVVKQRGQFSFIRAGRFPAIPRATAAWRKAVAIARIALDDVADGAAPRALFFHAKRVSPGWRGLTRVATVGNHVFYR